MTTTGAAQPMYGYPTTTTGGKRRGMKRPTRGTGRTMMTEYLAGGYGAAAPVSSFGGPASYMTTGGAGGLAGVPAYTTGLGGAGAGMYGVQQVPEVGYVQPGWHEPLGGGYAAQPASYLYEPMAGGPATTGLGGYPSGAYPAAATPLTPVSKKPSGIRGRWDKSMGSMQSGMGKMMKKPDLQQRGTTRSMLGEDQIMASKGYPVQAVPVATTTGAYGVRGGTGYGFAPATYTTGMPATAAAGGGLASMGPAYVSEVGAMGPSTYTTYTTGATGAFAGGAGMPSGVTTLGSDYNSRSRWYQEEELGTSGARTVQEPLSATGWEQPQMEVATFGGAVCFDVWLSTTIFIISQNPVVLAHVSLHGDNHSRAHDRTGFECCWSQCDDGSVAAAAAAAASSIGRSRPAHHHAATTTDDAAADAGPKPWHAAVSGGRRDRRGHRDQRCERLILAGTGEEPGCGSDITLILCIGTRNVKRSEHYRMRALASK